MNDRRLRHGNLEEGGSHAVDVCRPVRAGSKRRLEGLAQRGYGASLKRWFHGVREHWLFTPGGRIAFVLQAPGNRHDVRGLYWEPAK